MNNVGGVEVNAFQVHSDGRAAEVDQGGLRADRDRGALEGAATVAGSVGGIVAQIENGETGWLVDSIEECAEACIEILRDPVEARQRALRGKEHVRRHFLTPRLLRDWLVLFDQLAGNDTAATSDMPRP